MQFTSCGAPIGMMDTRYFLSRQTLIASEKPGMNRPAKRLAAVKTRVAFWTGSAKNSKAGSYLSAEMKAQASVTAIQL